jgi:hypothetical protein
MRNIAFTPSKPIAAPITIVKQWPNCPDCKQSATGVHAGKADCNRCGWAAGITTAAVALAQ